MVTFASSCDPEPAAVSLHPVMFFRSRLEPSSLFVARESWEGQAKAESSSCIKGLRYCRLVSVLPEAY